MLNLGLLEKYAGQDDVGRFLLCDKIKDTVARRPFKARPADSYNMLFRTLWDYYQNIRGTNALGLLNGVFTLKVGIYVLTYHSVRGRGLELAARVVGIGLHYPSRFTSKRSTPG